MTDQQPVPCVHCGSTNTALTTTFGGELIFTEVHTCGDCQRETWQHRDIFEDVDAREAGS